MSGNQKQSQEGPSRTSSALRICMPTSRKLSQMAFQCGRYEAQDVLVESEDVDLIQLAPRDGFRWKQEWQRRLLYHDFSKRLAFVNPGIQRVRLKKDYDLFLVVCQTYWDLLHANAIEGWEDHCKTSLCWIDELWAAAVPSYKYWLPSLRRFDHVVLGMQGSVNAVGKVMGRPCHYVPGGVDAMRFSPYPNPPERVVDVYSIGRRCEGVHRAFGEMSGRKEIFYLYDSLKGGEMPVTEHREHRELFASIAKRSRFFMVAPGKMNQSEETQGQVEVGFRYFEGAAAGTVMLGQTPDCEPFRKMFGWEDAVVEVKPDGSDVVEVVRGLRGDPERLRRISQRNAVGALLGHDWIYRWKEVLHIAGVNPGPGIQRREKCLKELAKIGGSDTELTETRAERAGELL